MKGDGQNIEERRWGKEAVKREKWRGKMSNEAELDREQDCKREARAGD